ncbi:Lrp/AsnC family transcriptional regulator [Emcibacter nanhaiensis]|uniref:Lrp/AsnC family transcriptional regulator n=1 Tax=Emcibacter nanhaiensis TaxID=1505037 RepID=A0A501PHP6_9PROT|nr:Lrp/AsnC family transcriptional regulator [Emcibacter nanhaiensis]TPD59542.1 Lrp/AsnC family transcriptional regulator [Emcibacter nanhaiensis]
MKKLDAIDRKILDILTHEGRISWRDLADKISLSLTPTLRRVRQMEEDGIITGYRAELNDSLFRGSMGVMISITLDRQVDEVLHVFEQAVSDIPEVVDGHLMSGKADYMLHAYVNDLDHYRELLSVLTKLKGIAHIESSFVLNTFKLQSKPVLTVEI